MSKPQTTRKNRAGTAVRTLILDRAETLFAERGFFGTSVRDITEHAGVRLAAINYHFGSKEALFRDVLMRRASVLNAERLQRLAGVSRAGSAQRRIRQVVAAFVEPLLSRTEDAGWRNYFALIAQVASSKLWALSLVARDFNRVARVFIDAFRHAFPHAGTRRLHHSYQFMLAATLYGFSDNRRVDSLTRGVMRSDDFAGTAGDLVTFVASGVCSLCGKPARYGT